MFDSFAVPEAFFFTMVAIAIGGLIGLEREKDPARKYAGFRTLAILAGSGAITVYVAELAESSVIIAIYLTLAGILALSVLYIRFKLVGENIGLTTTATVFLVALLGILAGFGQLFEATSIAIVTAFLLAEKDRLHSYIDRLTYEELSDTMKLGALVFILYPILPTEPVDPLGIVNLQEVLIFAIFVLLIEFASYVSMRQFGGSKGLQVTGLLAGGANSFATAGIMARMANQSRQAIDAASAGLLLATISMVLRNVGIASVLAASIFWYVWKPALAMVAMTIGITYWLLQYGDEHESFDIEMDSPFSFHAALKFSVVYVAILIVSVLAQEALGDVGLYATAFVGGLASSAAVSVSAATVLNEGTAGVEPAAGMVVLGIMASLTSKIVLIELINGEMRTKGALPLAGIAVVGLAVFFLL